ncbi:MAG: carboxypeptidase regulatory-like domain-containing protein [Myxococcales bacterium]|nr:carboxypeptidase regulatory-like domain-containing protein [Myxococcales bacterium]
MSTSRSALCFLMALIALVWTLEAEAVKVRVRGGSSAKLVALEGNGEVTLRGQVVDDVGASMGRIGIRIEALGPGDKVERMGAPRACPGDEAFGTVRSDGDAYVVTTDDRGVFCVRKPGSAAGLRFRARFVGNNLFEGTDLAITPTAEGEDRAETVLRFDSAPTTIDLDRESVTFTVSLKVDRDDAARLVANVKRDGHEITLVDERGETVARTTTGGDGRARFDVPTKGLGGPGLGELVAQFAGSPQLASSRASAFVTRVASTQLEAPASVGGDPDSGIEIDVEVNTARGGVDGGIVEAVQGDASIGAGQVEDGRARVVVSFAGGAATTVPITLRYVPSAPFYVPGPPATVDVRIVGPSAWRQALLAGVGLGLAAWIVLKWRRAPKAERTDSVLPPPPSGRPEILVLDRPSGLKGWRGVVTDAHDGFPIVGAELRIVVPTFTGRGVLAETKTDAEGTFALEVEAPREARLVVEGELHATYEQPLPSPSVLRVALVTRRRALLDRLVRWAKSRGMPFDSSKEPTPGHVRRVAARNGTPNVEAWASKIEHAAFGPEAVTRAVEQEVAQAEPSARDRPASLEGGAP